MIPEVANAYHGFQISLMADVGVDVVAALTMGYVGETAGIALAARAASVPVVVSFRLETDGRWPTGMPLSRASRPRKRRLSSQRRAARVLALALS